MSITIVAVSNAKQLREFINVPWLLHSHDPNWVPPLRLTVKELLDTVKHPFYKQAELQCWIAYRNKKPVGRIAAILNHAHNQFHQESVGFWGFFESENAQDVVNALFHTVENWFGQFSIKVIRGPVSPSTNYECGLQISAFDTKPYIMMPQNPVYYPDLIESLGHQKAKDLHAWLCKIDSPYFDAVLEKQAKKLAELANVTIRTIDMENYEKEFRHIFEAYNDAWEKNWGFIPMSAEEFRHAALEMKPILVPGSVWIIEVDGETAAFGVLIPNLNQILIRMRNGKLFPSGLLKLLWHTKVSKKLIDQTRVPVLGVRKKFRHLALGTLLYTHLLRTCYHMGVKYNECSWILEDNRPMRTALRWMKAEHYKTYRIYEKQLDVSST